MAIWEYVEDGVCKRGQDELHLIRVKNPDDFTEILRIEVLTDGKKNGSCEYDFLTWENEVKSLARYGIYFDSGDKYKIKSIIKSNFLDIPTVDGESEKAKKEAEIEGLYNMFCDYIKEHKSDSDGDETFLIIKAETYCIPIEMFEKEMDSSTSNMKTKEVRLVFSNADYTEHNEMRTDKMVKNSANKSIRCIAFWKKNVDTRLAEVGADSGE